jgi:serine/threonine-protein kinase RsbW
VSARYKEWRRELPATLDAIEQICGDFHEWRLGGCTGLNSFSVELLLREALTNSVLHGSLGDSGKRISCSIRAKADRVVIAVRDEGKGFNWRSAWSHRAEPSAVHGRGIEILRHYGSLVRFNRAGNSVTIVKRYEATA